MRNSRIACIAAAALAVLATTAGCTGQSSPNAAACATWAKTSNAWTTAETSTTTSSAALASLRSGLRADLEGVARTATGSVGEAMTAAASSLPQNALHIVEPGSTYRTAWNSAAQRVQKACASDGHTVDLDSAPTLP